MVIWGLKDNNSWRESSSPLLYTAGIGKKPAWYAVRSALRHRSIVDDANGVQDLRMDPITPDSIYYDLYGRRVAQPVKGLYITKGKKIVK